MKQCEFCKKSFKTKEGFDKHVNKSCKYKKRETNLICPYCQHEFDTEQAYEKHLTRCSKRPTFQSFTCSNCKKVFSHKSSLVDHSSSCVQSKETFPCDDCKEVFDTKYEWKYHRHLRCTVRKIRMYECKFACGYKAYLRFNTTNHEGQFCKLNQNKSKFECGCGSVLNSARFLDFHKKYYCNDGERKKYYCPACDISFTTPQHRNDHYMYDCIKNENKIDLACPTCNRIQLRNTYYHHLKSCEQENINGKIQPIKFTYEDVLKSIRNQTKVEKSRNYVYLISNGSEFLQTPGKSNDYIGTGRLGRA